MPQEVTNSVFNKIQEWKSASFQNDFHLSGISKEQWFYFFKSSSAQLGHQLMVFDERSGAEDFFNLAQDHFDEDHSKLFLFFPSIEDSPYSSILYPESDLFKQFEVLQILSSPEKIKERSVILITSSLAFLQKLPPLSFFKKNTLVLKTDDIISPYELSAKLTSLGFRNSSTIEGPGTFSRRGEIFDIHPLSSKAFRLHYFDDLIEKIVEIDPESYKTIKNTSDGPCEHSEIVLGPAPQIVINQEYRNNLRQNIPTPQTIHKEKFNKRKLIFENLAQNLLFENYPVYLPFFFENNFSLFDFVSDLKDITFTFFEYESIQREINSFQEANRNLWQEIENDLENSNILPSPEKFFLNNSQELFLKKAKLLIGPSDIRAGQFSGLDNTLNLELESSLSFIIRNIGPTPNRPDFIQKAMSFIKKIFENTTEISFCYEHDSALSEFRLLLDHFFFSPTQKENIIYQKMPLHSGFYHLASRALVLTENDLFAKSPRGHQSSKAKRISSSDPDLFAEQLSTLKKGDYVIHSEFGIGQYAGLESMNVGGSHGDFLVLHYAEGDKIYVPVYKINLIQKYADETSSLKINSIRQNKFLAVKEKAKLSAKKLAFDLIKLLAEREMAVSYAFSPPDDQFKEFELSFNYEETPDQGKAIDQVLLAMQKNRPMDFLVCGDVGFGKTEVAMRACYKAILDQKQVAVLVPTTILALQHFMSFTKRFKEFPVKIEFLSRFKSAKESKIILEQLKTGTIDIVIGTHKLLSENIKYKDLGLVVIDEEHRFGVAHKEKLKLMKASVDFLTLTATPIPRTLQLAFMGLRDLALIKTPPPKRQSIKTYLIKEDELTLKNAILHELKRGGQVFIVHNKVHDMESYFAYIKELVPEAKIVFAHGQMSETELEKRIRDFYEGKFQILIATTIIESGIDIPNANTLIIDRADTFGLAQLHQLRGRIGRSDRKAYAYFVVPENKVLSTDAERRLKALQTYTELGSGFALASCDLEIRGAGDILGAEQSGQIEQVGLELYTELLKEAVLELKGEKEIINKNIEITTPFTSLIPQNYISDPGARLKFYKRLSNCFNLKSLDEMEEEIQDIYGPPPAEMENLFTVIKIRNLLHKACLKSLSATDTVLILKFNPHHLEKNLFLRDKIVDTFIKRPKIYQFSPDYKVTYKHKEKLTPQVLYAVVKDIAQQIVPC